MKIYCLCSKTITRFTHENSFQFLVVICQNWFFQRRTRTFIITTRKTSCIYITCNFKGIFGKCSISVCDQMCNIGWKRMRENRSTLSKIDRQLAQVKLESKVNSPFGESHMKHSHMNLFVLPACSVAACVQRFTHFIQMLWSKFKYRLFY